MAETPENSQTAEEPEVESPPRGLPLRQLWQVPALVLGLTLFGVGIYMVFPESEENEYSAVMGEVEGYLQKGDLDRSEQVLKEVLGPYMGSATERERGRYSMLWGDLIYLRQAQEGWDKAENHMRTRDYYVDAMEMGVELDATHQQRLAETYVALGAEAQAVVVLEQMSETAARRRHQVLRKIIERRRAANASPAELAPILSRFLEEVNDEQDVKERRAQELWAVTLQANGYMQTGSAEHAVQYLQRRMIGFMAEGGEGDLAPLKVSLAKAFSQLGEHSEAQRWYRAAQQQILPADPLNAEILVGLGQIALSRDNDVRAALESFSTAEREYPTSGVYIESLIGPRGLRGADGGTRGGDRPPEPGGQPAVGRLPVAPGHGGVTDGDGDRPVRDARGAGELRPGAGVFERAAAFVPS